MGAQSFVPPTSVLALLPSPIPPRLSLRSRSLLSWRRAQAAPAPIKPARKTKSAPKKRQRDDDDDDDDEKEACTPLEAAAAKYNKLPIKKLKVLPMPHSQSRCYSPPSCSSALSHVTA